MIGKDGYFLDQNSNWKDSAIICIIPEFFKNQMKFTVGIQVGKAVFIRNGFNFSIKALYFFYLPRIEISLLEQRTK